MKPFNSISTFGSIDADSDDLLLQVFEDHDVYKAILDLSKFVVIGRKGTGKTAIFKKLLTLPKDKYLNYGHTFTDYPWHYHDAQKMEGMPDHEKYVNSWKYLILLTLSKIILNFDMSLPYDEESLKSMSRIEQFVIDSYGSRDPDLTQLFTPSRKIRLKPHFKVVVPGFEIGTTPEHAPVSDLPKFFTEVNKNLTEHVLNCLNPDNYYYIAFDQLDLGFDPSSKDYNNRIIGLILAAKELNNNAKQRGKNFASIIFLRDDIYDQLHFEDKNKITQNYIAQIEWDNNRTRNTLKNMMEKRFSLLLADNSQSIKWEDVFDETQEMPGHQTKYMYMLGRTYLRPRDIIKYSNDILNHFKRRKETQKDSADKFVNIDLNTARNDYGNYFYEELDDEIHKHIPNYRDYFEIFKSLGFMQFSKTNFIDEFERRKVLSQNITDPLTILKMFFQFSVIGFYRAGGKGYGGSEYIFKYIDRKAQFDSTAEQFRIHYGLIDVLGLKLYSRT